LEEVENLGTVFILTEKPKRPKYGGHEKRLERPKYKGHTKEEATREGQSEEGENPVREKLGTSVISKTKEVGIWRPQTKFDMTARLGHK